MQSQGLCCDPLSRLQHHVLPSHAARISHVSPGHRLSLRACSCGDPAGTRKVFAWCKALYWPQCVREQDFPSCPLCPAQSFSRRDTATSHWLTEVGACPQTRGRYLGRASGPSSCKNWDGFGAELVLGFIARAEAVFMFLRSLWTQLKSIKQVEATQKIRLYV